jgi:uncharacterized protein (UPF0264 family)
MTRFAVQRTAADVEAIRAKGDHTDSRKAGWFAIGRGSEVIHEVQQIAARKKNWLSLADGMSVVNEHARRILAMRLEAIHKIKQAPHHRGGFRPSRHTGLPGPRPVTALCLVSGHIGQEIPGLVSADRVVVDAEHMEQALGPATLTEIFKIRKHIGENVYISTNVSETPQLVRALATGRVDTRATAALTAAKVVAALNAGADVVKVGFANMDPYKQDLPSREVLAQMKLVRQLVDDVVKEKLIVVPLAGRYPLVSVFFPEIGINSQGDRPIDVAREAIRLTAQGGWQGVLIDTFEKYTGRAYRDFFTAKDTADLAKLAHAHKLEYWVAGSIQLREVPDLLRAKVDLICFGGAARHATGVRVANKNGKRDESIKRPLVEALVKAFEKHDPRAKARP